MTANRIDLLTRRHRECLRRVRQLKGSKEIAIELGIGKSTVDGYLTEAVRLLGARNRREAAMLLDAHEAAAAQGLEPVIVPAAPDPETRAAGPDSDPDSDPSKIMPDSARLADPPAGAAETSMPSGGVAGGAGQGVKPVSFRLPLPLRQRGQTSNDLGIAQRLLWIPTIAVALAIGFGMLASGLEVLTTIVETSSHLLR